MVNDPIADMLTRIRNANLVKQKQVADAEFQDQNAVSPLFRLKKGSSTAMP
jgi:ribosomal protein S8